MRIIRGYKDGKMYGSLFEISLGRESWPALCSSYGLIDVIKLGIDEVTDM